MRDPRERKEWTPSFSLDDGSELPDHEWRAWLANIDRELRQRVKIACFTEDRLPDPGLAELQQFHRGYSRARMWEQYADGHAGGCLIFDKRGLIDRATRSLSAFGAVHHGQVTYADVPIGDQQGMLHFTASAMRNRGASAVGARFIDEHWKNLYLTKNLDWASEIEYRILLVEDEIAGTWREFAYGESLLGVVLGEGFDSRILDRVAGLAATHEIDRGRLARCSWLGGRPNAVPA
jgi:hypothetical protein